MFCTNCGEQIISLNANFCRGCGVKVAKGADQIKATKSFTAVIPTTRVKRALNFALDYVGFYVFSYFIGHTAVTMGPIPWIDRVNEWVVGGVLLIIYFVFFEGIWAKSPGKLITRTRVVMEDERRPGFKAILIRTLARLIPFEFLTFFKPKHPRGLHDRLSKTVVVDDL